MDLKDKQLMERNKYAMIGNIIIASFLMLGAVSSIVYGATINEIIRLAAGILDIAVCVLFFGRLKYSVQYKHVAFLSIAIVYVVTLLFVSAPGYYAVLYPIALLLTIYADRKVTLMGAVLACVMLVVFCVRMFGQGSMIAGDIFTMWGIVIPAVIIVFFSTEIHSRQTKESLDMAGKGVEDAMKVSGRIVELAENLNRKFESAKEVSENLNSTSNTSNASISEIAEITKINANALERQTEMTSDIQNSIRNAADEAKQIEEASVRANERVGEGVSLIEQLKAHSAEVERISNDANRTTRQLNDSIRDVQAITETILGISNQTNLLALNASIEAARAGEAGKGFAVVADEIRNLSEGTRDATQKISEIISRLTTDAELASQSMSESAEYAQQQNELITEAGEKLKRIKEDTGALRDGVVHVSRSVDEIDAANEKIVESITDLSAKFQEVTASAATALSLSDSSVDTLNGMNRLLKEISDIAGEMEQIAEG